MTDLNKIIEELSKLTVVEAAELSRQLEEKWGVTATAPVAAAPAAGGAAPDSEEKSELGSAAKLYLARVHADSGHFDDSKILFEEVMLQDQSSEMMKNVARISLISLLEQKQDWQGAKEMVNVLSKDRWNDLQLFIQARIARHEGDNDASKTHLQNLLNQEPDSAYRQTAEIKMLLP